MRILWCASPSSQRIRDEFENDEFAEYRVDLIESRGAATESLQPTKRSLDFLVLTRSSEAAASDRQGGRR